MNSLERTAFRASQADFEGRLMFWIALFCLVLAIVLVGAQRYKLQSSGGGASSGSGTVVQPVVVRPGHPSSTKPEQPMTECERLDGDNLRCP